MPEPRFNPGDPATGPGGFPMMVESYDPDTGLYRCTWPEGTHVRRADFREDELAPFPPPGN